MPEPDQTAADTRWDPSPAALARSIALGLGTFARIVPDEALSAAAWIILGQAAGLMHGYHDEQHGRPPYLVDAELPDADDLPPAPPSSRFS